MNLDFELFWQAFDVPPEYTNRHHACYDLWRRQAEGRQQAILDELNKLSSTGDKTKQRNPYFFIQDFRMPRPQTLSYNDYYDRYGTTEPRDGWKMANPTGNKVIYVK